MKIKKNLRMNAGVFLRRARKDKSLTASQLGKMVGLSQQQISRYELGITGMSIETLDMFLTILDKTWENFFNNVIDCYHQDVKLFKENKFY